MGDKAWKAFERRIASLFNTTRNGCVTGDGTAGSGSADLENEYFSVECKLLGRPSWSAMVEACLQSERNASEHREPVAVIKKKGAGQETLFVQRAQTFIDWRLGGGLADDGVCFMPGDNERVSEVVVMLREQQLTNGADRVEIDPVQGGAILNALLLRDIVIGDYEE
tara:strand:- start:1372 stop:1872 length:501 start_codon:yes stop_codon:yes gene_type:complete